jgi:hypothetical protein
VRGSIVLLAGLAAAAAAAVACESLIGVDYGGEHLATCNHAEPPAAPSGGDTGGSPAFTEVVYTVDWGDGDDAQNNPLATSIGYDLDHLCTGLLDAPRCEPASWTGARVKDGPGGIDNAVGLLLYDQGAAFGLKPFTSSFLTNSLQRGEQAPPGIVRISEWSGFAVDTQVTVEWFVPLKPGATPQWDGTDAWPILYGTADATGDSGIVSRYVDHAAYVTGYELVAHFPRGAPIVISNVPVATTSLLLTANLAQPVLGQWELENGIVAGVGAMSELFKDLPALSSSFAGVNEAGKPNAICKDTPNLYPKVKTWLCSHLDMLQGNGPGCDAASFGMGFTARPGNVGAIPPATPPIVYCAPGGDPTGDTCATPPQ